jgi:hypothetical protein
MFAYYSFQLEKPSEEPRLPPIAVRERFRLFLFIVGVPALD